MKREHLWGPIVPILIGTLVSLGSAQPPSGVSSKDQEPIQRKKSVRFWGEFYNESTSSRRNRDNLISLSHVKQGLRIDPLSGSKVEMYLLLRYGKDLHKDFWNNRVEAGVGLRGNADRWEFLIAYLEWIWGHYVRVPEDHPQPSERNYIDVCSGLSLWYAWSRSLSTSLLGSFPLRLWGQFYADVSYSRSQGDNVVGYVDARWGPHLFRLWGLSADGYGVVYLTKDINKDFWSNKAEMGPGIWLKPIPRLDLRFSAEWIHGYYFGIEGKDPNPYPQHYRDRRAGLTLWVGW